MEDEHERDMQLASGTRGEGMGDGKSSKLAWFLRRELWFAVWVVLGAVAGHVLAAPLALAVVLFLPIVLLVADDMAAFASSYLIDDEDAPSLGGLVVRNLLTGLVMAALGWLLVNCAVWTGSIPEPLSRDLVIAVVTAAMVTVLVLVTLTAPYTKLIERLLDEGRETPGVAASLGAMAGASVLFVALVFAVGRLTGAL
jgi:hypothetical protein